MSDQRSGVRVTGVRVTGRASPSSDRRPQRLSPRAPSLSVTPWLSVTVFVIKTRRCPFTAGIQTSVRWFLRSTLCPRPHTRSLWPRSDVEPVRQRPSRGLSVRPSRFFPSGLDGFGFSFWLGEPCGTRRMTVLGAVVLAVVLIGGTSCTARCPLPAEKIPPGPHLLYFAKCCSCVP